MTGTGSGGGLRAFLETLDRRWIFLAMGLLVLVPLLVPIGLRLKVSEPVRGFASAIDRLPDGSLVMMSCDYDPSGKPELTPMTKTALRHLWGKHCRIVVTCLWTGGPGFVDQTLDEVATEMRAAGHPLEYGRDWVFLGFKPGYEAAMVLMGQGLEQAYPLDHHGNRTSTLPIMREARDYSSFPLLVNISAGYPGTKEWVQQVNTRFHLPMVSGCTAVSAPEFYPYLQSGQLLGLLGGMAGAAEYESLRGEKGTATRGMDAQSLAHLFVAVLIVAGNVLLWTRPKEARA